MIRGKNGDVDLKRGGRVLVFYVIIGKDGDVDSKREGGWWGGDGRDPKTFIVRNICSISITL